MREIVIKPLKGLAIETAREPAGGEHSPPAATETQSADASESVHPDNLLKPVAAPAEHAAPGTAACELAAPPRPARRRGERNFLVAYEGKFVGVYEAEEELTPNEAFLRVAGDLASRKDFDPRKLQLYKPVLLRSARPAKRARFVSGTLTEIGGRIRERRGKDAGQAPPSLPEERASEERDDPAASEPPVEERALEHQT